MTTREALQEANGLAAALEDLAKYAEEGRQTVPKIGRCFLQCEIDLATAQTCSYFFAIAQCATETLKRVRPLLQTAWEELDNQCLARANGE